MNRRAHNMQRVLAMLLIGSVCTPAIAADEPARLTIKARDAWSSVFENSPIKLHYTLSGPAGTEVVVTWKLTAAERTIERGEAPATIGKGGSQEAVISVPLPK